MIWQVIYITAVIIYQWGCYWLTEFFLLWRSPDYARRRARVMAERAASFDRSGNYKRAARADRKSRWCLDLAIAGELRKDSQ